MHMPIIYGTTDNNEANETDQEFVKTATKFFIDSSIKSLEDSINKFLADNNYQAINTDTKYIASRDVFVVTILYQY